MSVSNSPVRFQLNAEYLLQHVLPWACRAAVLLLLLGLLVSLLMYGVGVYLEHSVQTVGKETRSLRDENIDLQIHLDRIRSFEAVGGVSHQVKGLHVPTDMVDVAQRRPKPFKLKPKPVYAVPRVVYGY